MHASHTSKKTLSGAGLWTCTDHHVHQVTPIYVTAGISCPEFLNWHPALSGRLLCFYVIFNLTRDNNHQKNPPPNKKKKQQHLTSLKFISEHSTVQQHYALLRWRVLCCALKRGPLVKTSSSSSHSNKNYIFHELSACLFLHLNSKFRWRRKGRISRLTHVWHQSRTANNQSDAVTLTQDYKVKSGVKAACLRGHAATAHAALSL